MNKSRKTKGKTYEEIYGIEKATQLKKDRSKKLKKYLEDNPDELNRRIERRKNNARFYDVWVKQYGVEEADKRRDLWLSTKNKFKVGDENIAKIEDVKNKISKSTKDRWLSPEYKDKMREQAANNMHFKCVEHTPETKTKIRLAAIKRIESQIKCGMSPNYNSTACQYFNQLMLETNTYIQHAENGGEYHIKELGYWVDGYDKENNIVYEYDEKQHFDKHGFLCKKDIRRQKEIETFLKCKFIRIKYE